MTLVDSYEEVAQVYTCLVEGDSPKAAAALRRIHAAAGALAALRAALILRALKIEVRENHFLPNIGVYAYLLREYPEAFAELEQAIAHCLLAWGIDDVNVTFYGGNVPRVLG